MGDVIDLQLRRAARLAPPAPTRPGFYFDVCSPFSYLAAERVERALGPVEWVAVDGSALPGAPHGDDQVVALRACAERHARALRLPLEWPERFPAEAPSARRVAQLACELGVGGAFALAAGRLAYCGGFALDDPETLAEASAAAGVPLAGCMEAVGDGRRDDELLETARGLAGAGVRELPAIQVGKHWFGGVTGLIAAGERLRIVERASRPLAPAG